MPNRDSPSWRGAPCWHILARLGPVPLLHPIWHWGPGILGMGEGRKEEGQNFSGVISIKDPMTVVQFTADL